MRYRFIFSLVTLFAITFSLGFGQISTINHQQRLLQSFKSGDMSDWVKVIEELQVHYNRSKNNTSLFELAHAQYGYIGYLLGIKDTKKARQVLSEAEDNIEQLLKVNPRNADALALKGALVAYHISLSPIRAPFLGPRSMGLIDESLSINPNSPQALIEKGNAAHYAPSMFGGDPVVAVKYYSKAIAALEKQNSNQQTWLFLNTQAQLALAFEKAKQFDNANRTYLEILRIAPDLKWVRDELYPNFLKNNP